MRNRAAIALTACVLATVLTGAASPASPFDLKQALQFALAHSPDVDTALKQAASAEASYKNSVAKMLPSVDFSTTDGLQNNVPISSDTSTDALITSNPQAPWYSSLSLGVTESLYDNGVSLTQMSVAALARDVARIAADKARDSLALNVSTEFYRYSQLRTLLDLQRQQLEMLNKQFRILTSEYEQGFKTRADYLRLNTQVQRAQIDLNGAENNATQSVANLRKLVGAPIDDPLQPEFVVLTVPRSAKAIALPSTPPPLEDTFDFRVSKLQKEANDAQVTLARRADLPQLTATASASYINQNYINSTIPFAENHQLTWNALLTLQYNLFDWGTRKRNIDIAEYTRDTQDDSLDSGLLQLRSQIDSTMSDIHRVTQSSQLTQDLLKAEEESYRALESQYREGKVTYLDLVTEMSNLLDARIQFSTSYFDSLTDSAQYHYFEGKLYDSLMAQ